MPEAERTAYMKKLLRQLRKQQGLKEEDSNFGNTTPGFANSSSNAAPVDLFNTSSKSDWYFANTALRARGLNDFKAKWGNRPNADNWQRSAAIKQAGGRSQEPQWCKWRRCKWPGTRRTKTT